MIQNNNLRNLVPINEENYNFIERHKICRDITYSLILLNTIKMFLITKLKHKANSSLIRIAKILDKIILKFIRNCLVTAEDVCESRQRRGFCTFQY